MFRDVWGWVRWHGVEITVVAAAVVVAVVVSPWWTVAVVVVVAHWAWVEVRVHRALSGRRPSAAAATADTDPADADDTAAS